MAFTFNKKDIQLAGAALHFGGDYNVIIKDTEYKGRTRSDQEYFVATFEVLDGEDMGAHITQVFIDDTDSEKPFRYREINAVLTATNAIQDGVTVEIRDLAKGIIGQQLAVRVKEFEEGSYNGRKTFNPKVSDYAPLMKDGSKPDKTNPNPKFNNNKSSVPATNPFGGAPIPSDDEIPPFPDDDPFGTK